jgi:hypothetical protein
MKIWTFIIFGGQGFSLVLPANPKLDHPGGSVRTVWKVYWTEAQALNFRDTIQKCFGASVEIHTESESEEQAEERQALQDGTWADPLVTEKL